jgi:hypothetical protein
MTSLRAEPLLYWHAFICKKTDRPIPLLGILSPPRRNLSPYDVRPYHRRMDT